MKNRSNEIRSNEIRTNEIRIRQEPPVVTCLMLVNNPSNKTTQKLNFLFFMPFYNYISTKFQSSQKDNSKTQVTPGTTCLMLANDPNNIMYLNYLPLHHHGCVTGHSP